MDTRLLDVAIGLVLVFALTSLLASIITEAIRNYSGQRGKTLNAAIASMLGDDQKLADAFYAQPLIRTLYLGERHPSYLEADLFKTGFFALLRDQLSPPLAPGQGTPQEYVNALSAAIHAHAANVPNSPPNAPLPGLATVVATLQSLCAGVGGDWPAFEARITQWFNATGDRSIGWFTRRTQVLLFGVGLFLAGALNINAIVISNTLWNDPVVRDAVARQAEIIVAERSGADAATGPAATAGASPDAALPLPLGTPNTATSHLGQARKLISDQLDALINSLKSEKSNAKIATTLMEQASILRSELAFALDAQSLQSIATTAQTTTAATIDLQSSVDAQLKQLKALAASDAAQRLDPLLLNVVNRRIDGIEKAIAIARALAAPVPRPSATATTQRPLPVCLRPIMVPPVVAPKTDTTGTDPNAVTAAGTSTTNADNDVAWALGKLCALGIPMGWSEQAGLTIYPGHPVLEFFVTLCGWAITAAACTLGAQFWFDLLGKLVKLRAAGRAPAEGDTKPATSPSAAGGTAPVNAPAPFQYALNEVERGLSEAQVRRLQQFIRMPSAKISGLLDGPTREAIVQWHRDRGQGDSNELTAADVNQLLQEQAGSAVQATDPTPAPDPGASAPQASAQPLGQAHNTDEDACGCELPVVNPTLDEHLPGTRGGEQ